MFIKSFKSVKSLNKNESGQAALETAIILIAFVVVASVFAFAILSAGSASTDKGKQAINAGLQGVQSSMSIKGSVNANASGTTSVDQIVFDVALVAGGSPVDLTDPKGDVAAACSGAVTVSASAHKNAVVINYSDAAQTMADIPWSVCFIGKTNGAVNNLLEDGELAQITVDVTTTAGLTKAPIANTAFTLEVKPPTGSVINVQRTIPAAISPVMNLN
jgi:flagellin FlaB